jgi:hypothetical protein
MNVSDDRLDKAMAFLAQTDSEFAEWRGAMLRAEYMAECAESLAYAAITEGSVEDRKRAAKVAEPVKQAMENYFKAVVEFERLKARRTREVLVVELWRSVNANRRVGNVQ